MQAVIRKILLIASGHEPVDIKKYSPPDPSKFSFDLEVFVGVQGGGEWDGSDRFDIEICTPSWLMEHLDDGCIIGHGKIIVDSFSYERIIQFIEAYIQMCRGDSVDDVVRRVGLLGEWEYEWENCH